MTSPPYFIHSLLTATYFLLQCACWIKMSLAQRNSKYKTSKLMQVVLDRSVYQIHKYKCNCIQFELVQKCTYFHWNTWKVLYVYPSLSLSQPQPTQYEFLYFIGAIFVSPRKHALDILLKNITRSSCFIPLHCPASLVNGS